MQTSATDLQTKADRLVQMSICSSLARKFPKLTIIGEEVRATVPRRFITDVPLNHVMVTGIVLELVFEHKRGHIPQRR